MVAQPLLPKINLSGFKGYFDNYVDPKDLKLGGDLVHALFHHALSSRVMSFRVVIEGASHEELLRENNQFKSPTLPSTTFLKLGSNPDLSSTNA